MRSLFLLCLLLGVATCAALRTRPYVDIERHGYWEIPIESVQREFVVRQGHPFIAFPEAHSELKEIVYSGQVVKVNGEVIPGISPGYVICAIEMSRVGLLCCRDAL